MRCEVASHLVVDGTGSVQQQWSAEVCDLRTAGERVGKGHRRGDADRGRSREESCGDRGTCAARRADTEHRDCGWVRRVSGSSDAVHRAVVRREIGGIADRQVPTVGQKHGRVHLCGGRSRCERVGKRRAVDQHDRGRVAESSSDRKGGTKAVGPGIAGGVIAHHGELRLNRVRDARGPAEQVDGATRGQHPQDFGLGHRRQRGAGGEQQRRIPSRREGDANEGVRE